MFRHLVMFPQAADPSLVEDLIERTAAVFRQGSGFRSITASVDGLMGPSAKAGEFGRIMEADFDTLDDALAVVQGESFRDVMTAAESLEPTIFLFEHREI